MLKYLKESKYTQDKPRYWLYLFYRYIRRYKLFSLPLFILMVAYSYYISIRLFGISIYPRVCFSAGLFRVRVKVAKSSSVEIDKGLIVFEKWRSGATTTIDLIGGSQLQIKDTFTIGDNCKIYLGNSAVLRLHGKSKTQPSGITSDTIILCSKEIEIGEGSIISWGCFISDSCQHSFNGFLKVAPVNIGCHVWVSEGVTCSPGSTIGHGSVIGAKSYVSGHFPPSVFIVGVPGIVKKTGIKWSH